jgi:hypothetical protein
VTLRPGWKRVAWWLAGGGALVGASAVRVVSEGRAELARSETAWESGDVAGATVHARAAARAYVPFASHVDLAYARLRTIARAGEGRGDVESALFAWRAIRAAANGSRSFLTAHARQRDAADTAISRLSARSRAVPTTPAGGDDDGTKMASRAESTRPSWGALLLVGAALWVGAGFRIASPRSAERKFELRELRVPIVLASAGLVISWIALLLA